MDRTTKTPGLLLEFDKVMVVGDTHHNITAFIGVCLEALRLGITCLISVGDFGYLPQVPEGREFIAAVDHFLKKCRLQLIVVDGNHDDILALRALELDEAGMGIINARARYAGRGLHWNISGVEFLSIGGATSMDAYRRTQGIDWWAQENISYADANAAIDAGPADVVISHETPDEVTLRFVPLGDENAAQANRNALRAIVEAVRPSLLVHGHHHHRRTADLVLESGKTLRIEGLGRDGSGEDLYLVLDLAEIASNKNPAS